jgi:hypothetical protein
MWAPSSTIAIARALLAATLLACNPSPTPITGAQTASALAQTPSAAAAAAPSAVASAQAPPEPAARAAHDPGASSADLPRGCSTAELTGEAPSELICQEERPAGEPRCCEGPVDVVIRSGAEELLRVAACRFVPPECAHVHGHGNMDAHVRVLAGPPPELVVVEGGCEARAMLHGYVPPGVAAWSGCNHTRYRWDGKRLVAKKKP